MALNNLCPPALLYMLFSVTQIVIDTIKGQYNTALVKMLVAFVFTILLNGLCESGLGAISWIIVFIPFILMTMIVSILLMMFGLDPSTGKMKIIDDEDKINHHKKHHHHRHHHDKHPHPHSSGLSPREKRKLWDLEEKTRNDLKKTSKDLDKLSDELRNIIDPKKKPVKGSEYDLGEDYRKHPQKLFMNVFYNNLIQYDENAATSFLNTTKKCADFDAMKGIMCATKVSSGIIENLVLKEISLVNKEENEWRKQVKKIQDKYQNIMQKVEKEMKLLTEQYNVELPKM